MNNTLLMFSMFKKKTKNKLGWEDCDSDYNCLLSTITLTTDLFNSRINQSSTIVPSLSEINPSWPFLITCPLCQKPQGPLTEGECLMSHAPPASLVSATIMRQYRTGAVTPRWVGRSVGVRRRPIMRDKLLQTSASWRWADGVWKRQRWGGFPHELAEAKAEGKAEEVGEERPWPPNVAEKKHNKTKKRVK